MHRWDEAADLSLDVVVSSVWGSTGRLGVPGAPRDPRTTTRSPTPQWRLEPSGLLSTFCFYRLKLLGKDVVDPTLHLGVGLASSDFLLDRALHPLLEVQPGQPIPPPPA